SLHAGLYLIVVGWYVLLPAIAACVAAAIIWLRGSRKTSVYRLKSELDEFEAQPPRPISLISQNLRNAALLRYYALMRRVCAKAGIEDVPSVTPREYVDRVSQELRVDPSDARGFANAFDRARYGVELTSTEVQEASRFMSLFVE